MMEDPATEIERPADEWEALARAAERSGDYLGAYDLASSGLAEHPADVTLRYRAVLNLSRSGAHAQAAEAFAAYGLDDSDEERIVALSARILRETAFAEGGPAALGLLSQAARRYAELYTRTGGTFPGINAATLHLLAGDAETARGLARRVLATCVRDGGSTYDQAADGAAAALIVGDLGAAAEFIRICGTLHAGNFGAVASTRRQLGRICDQLGLDRAVFAILTPKAVLHYTGHMISPPGEPGRFPAAAEKRVSREIGAYLEKYDIGVGFGSLACGADILFAEALLARQATLHVVLPFAVAEFRIHSVERGGPGWLKRFDACLAQASSVSYATEDSYLGDRVLFGYCSRIAMGLTLLRGGHLDAKAYQLAVWDGAHGSEDVGTAADIALWQSRGLHTDIIHSGAGMAVDGRRVDRFLPAEDTPQRMVKAMLFGDIFHFSKLREDQIRPFVEEVLGTMSRVIDRYADRIDFRNTWGDGLYLVMQDVRSAMDCALDLQAAVHAIDLGAAGLPPTMGLRIGGHVGPVFPVADPILRTRNFMGSHVSRTARIEPVTPEGQVYVTEPFAALIALECDESLTCEYVGIVAAAKDYGSFRMYVVKPR